MRGLEKGDRSLYEVMERVAQYLGNVLITLINLFKPEAIIMGSKISSAGKFILEPLKEICFPKNCYPEFQKCHIFISDLPKLLKEGPCSSFRTLSTVVTTKVL